MSKQYAPVGRCIYCGDTVRLQDEHIIPEALGGRVVLPDASCPKCADVTSRFERIVARDMYWALRLKLGIQGKRHRRRERPTHWPGKISDGTSIKDVKIEIGNLPMVYMAIEMPPAGIIIGEPPRDTSPELKLHLKGVPAEVEQLLSEFDAGRWAFEHIWDWSAFNKLLAKIAHAYVVGLVGEEGCETLLVPLILGDAAHFSYLIGGVEKPEHSLSPGTDLELTLRPIRDELYLTVKVSLFGGHMPTYEVVAARTTQNELVLPKLNRLMATTSVSA